MMKLREAVGGFVGDGATISSLKSTKIIAIVGGIKMRLSFKEWINILFEGEIDLCDLTDEQEYELIVWYEKEMEEK